MGILRIRNWNEHYETNETRKLASLNWVKIPNRQDSLAFRMIAGHKRGSEIFAAWVLMVQVASKGKRSERGLLPLSPDELGIVTGFPADIFKLAIEFLKSPKIGWIEESPDNLPESPDASGDFPETPPVEGMERKNGMEDSGMEDSGMDREEARPKRKHGFEKSPFFDFQVFREQFPEWDEQKCRIWHEKASAYSEANGGRYLNWAAAVRNWERMDRERSGVRAHMPSMPGSATPPSHHRRLA